MYKKEPSYEARESLQEAIELILLSNRELAERQIFGKNVIREAITVNIYKFFHLKNIEFNITIQHKSLTNIV